MIQKDQVMLNYGMIYPDYILDSWIIDGDYSRTYENRISACDTVFFLNYVGGYKIL